jgi:hypothetical protein
MPTTADIDVDYLFFSGPPAARLMSADFDNQVWRSVVRKFLIEPADTPSRYFLRWPVRMRWPAFIDQQIRYDIFPGEHRILEIVIGQRLSKFAPLESRWGVSVDIGRRYSGCLCVLAQAGRLPH